jgi:hypothetical protein
VALWPELKPSTPGVWCELAKDVAALANSGGGTIVVGVDRTGTPTGWNPEHLLQISRARLVRELAAYFGERFDDLVVSRARKGNRRVATIEVGARAGAPVVLEKAGTYVDKDGREQRSFERGTVAFRHGGRSGPARNRDLARFARREEARVRREIQMHLRQVAKAPAGSEVIVVPPRSVPPASVGRVRVVDDPGAEVVARTDFDLTHPYRQKEVVEAVNRGAGKDIVSAYELQCVRRVHHTDSRDDFFHRPKFGSPQYSEAFVTWLLAQHQRDPQFFENAKAADHR